jgi:hypothetical protein
MANEEHLTKLKESVKAWNEWRRLNPEIVPDLNGAEFTGANLYGADLRQANLSNVNLAHANVSDANLEAANLSEANLGETDFFMANLLRANLREAMLRSTNLTGANLSEVELREASVSFVIFGDNDLSNTKGLETVRHHGPSTIGIDTIYRSQGRISPTFLRGAGVPENLITYLPSLVAPGAIQFYSCFISYSTKDQEFADRLHADLQDKGVRCWFAPHDVQSGKKLHEQIDEQIRLHEKLLLIISPNSMNSKWVETEIRNARNRELTEAKRVLFPVRLTPWDEIRKWKLFDADERRDLATEIREYYIPDFSQWKNHDLYQKEFEKLLRDLRTDKSKSA